MTSGGPTGGRTVNTETWNGTSWAEQDNLPTAIGHNTGNLGTATAGLSAGGSTSTANVASTFEWNRALNIKVLTD